MSTKFKFCTKTYRNVFYQENQWIFFQNCLHIKKIVNTKILIKIFMLHWIHQIMYHFPSIFYYCFIHENKNLNLVSHLFTTLNLLLPKTKWKSFSVVAFFLLLLLLTSYRRIHSVWEEDSRNKSLTIQNDE